MSEKTISYTYDVSRNSKQIYSGLVCSTKDKEQQEIASDLSIPLPFLRRKHYYSTLLRLRLQFSAEAISIVLENQLIAPHIKSHSTNVTEIEW